MPHTCKLCDRNVFGGGYCAYHQYIRHKQGGDLFKRKSPKAKPIPKESKTRKKERIYYTQHCKELTEEIKNENNGKIFCFFSGLEITGTPTYHHLKGRTGEFYTDKEWLVPAINKYHLSYHFTPVEELMKEPWYAEFLIRLKNKSTDAYNKEIRRHEKIQPLNPKLFDEIDYE